MPTSEAILPNHVPTLAAYGDLQTAYDFFNRELFAGRLPHCIITLARKKGAYGYFWAERFATRAGENIIDEIAINPSHIIERSDTATLSTLVHEMCHLEDQHFGKPGKNGYHGKSWADMMDAVGLTPSTTGQPGGKRTGQKVTHYIAEGGAFEAACAKLVATGYVLPYMERKFGDAVRAKAKAASKTKFCCPGCEAAAWGKPTLQLICGECEMEMEIADA